MSLVALLLGACLLMPGCGAKMFSADDAGGGGARSDSVAADSEVMGEGWNVPPATTGEASSDTGSSRVVREHLDRIGDAVVGDAFDEKDWLQNWTDRGVHPDVDCRHVGDGVLPIGMSMMVIDGRIARFELHRDVAHDAPRVRAPFGLFTGMARSDVLAALPDGVETSPHAYGDVGDFYLDWRQPSSPLGLRVEVVDEVADAIFWGDANATTLIEGCS